MRFSPARGAATHQDRVSQLHLERATARALRVSFPGVEQLRLDLSFDAGEAITPAPQTHVLHPAALAYFVFPCPYADCNGRFDLTSAVQAAMQSPAHRSDGMLECAGLRAGHFPEKRRCQLRLHFIVTATCQQAP